MEKIIYEYILKAKYPEIEMWIDLKFCCASRQTQSLIFPHGFHIMKYELLW